MMKICPKCGLEKAITEFCRNSHKKDGLQTQCKACKNITNQNWYSKNRDAHIKNCAKIRRASYLRGRQFLWDYLYEHPCVDCGEQNPTVLDFDHVRGKKKAILSQMVLSSIKIIMEEIDKCEVRCRNCHAIKTAKDQGWYKRINTKSR